MNYFIMTATQLVAAEGAGGLFDFNATLPLMAICPSREPQSLLVP